MNTVPNENICGLKREDFQTIVNGKKTDLYILRNALVTKWPSLIMAVQ